jgi:hypothetical protein
MARLVRISSAGPHFLPCRRPDKGSMRIANLNPQGSQCLGSVVSLARRNGRCSRRRAASTLATEAQQSRETGVGLSHDIDATELGTVRDGRQHVGARVSAKVSRATSLCLIRRSPVVSASPGFVSESGLDDDVATQGEEGQGSNGFHGSCHGDDSFVVCGGAGRESGESRAVKGF